MKLHNLNHKLRRLVFRRGFECFCIANYLIWLGVLIWDASILGDGKFLHFTWDRSTYIGVFAALFVASIACFKSTCRARFFAGFTMILGALMWFKLSLNFAQLYPPLNVNMFLYSVMALFSAVLGVYTIERSRSLGGKDDAK